MPNRWWFATLKNSARNCRLKRSSCPNLLFLNNAKSRLLIPSLADRLLALVIQHDPRRRGGPGDRPVGPPIVRIHETHAGALGAALEPVAAAFRVADRLADRVCHADHRAAEAFLELQLERVV